VAEAEPIDAVLAELFEAERRTRRLHDTLAARGGADRAVVLAAVRRALAEVAGCPPEEQTVRLVCLARLLGEFEGADVVDALIDVLASEHAEVRSEAGEQLQGLAFDRFKEVATGVERALDRLEPGSPALLELPYLLVDVPEGGVLKLLGRFLEHRDPDAVAAAIEALVEIGDPAAIKMLLPLQGDARTSTVAEGEQELGEVSVGDLAVEAIELLREAQAAAKDEG
jgi:HEAT repeat protein